VTLYGGELLPEKNWVLNVPSSLNCIATEHIKQRSQVGHDEAIAEA
jgi:hypothetical protein